jgi:O-antigen chain-terminating methyltransferase
LPDSSIGAITGFHIIEHLPWNGFIDLLEETVRLLKPGGVAIFETPNPGNVLVGSHNFYLDPTHRSPLPAPLVRFMVEARGLCNVEVLFLHPYPEGIKVSADALAVAERFNEYFYGPQDYAVIGRKV